MTNSGCAYRSILYESLKSFLFLDALTQKKEFCMTSDAENSEISGVSEVVESSEVRDVFVLKIGTCESLSGRSVLTYHIGYKGEPPTDDEMAFRNGIHVRIHENSGKGLFSDDWVPFSALDAIFEKEGSEIPVSSASLSTVFAGKSVNTAGFLLAVLKSEGLVNQLEDRKRSYVCVKSDAFFAEILELAHAAIPSAIAMEAEPEKGADSGKSDRKGKGQKG